MADEKKKVSALIPLKLLTALEDKGYTNQTECVIRGLEHLLTEDKQKIGEDIEKILEDAQRKIESLEEKLKAAPDLSEFSRLQARAEELEKHNLTLKAELEKSGRREEDLKQIHNNYFLQMQTLINQKAIEAPGNKKSILGKLKFW